MTSPTPPAPQERSERAPVRGRRSGFGWPHAFAAVGLAITLGTTLIVFLLLQNARHATSAVVEGGRKVLHDVSEIARAFTTATVTTRFLGYATEVSGTKYLQFATLDQQETFERRDAASTLWGQLDLPEVVVRAQAPVQYTYYVDFDASWSFTLDGDRIEVVAPAIRFNKPAIDASGIEYEVAQGSLLRNEDEALHKLKDGLSAMAYRRAQDNVKLVRELGRRRVEEFVESWLFRDFGEAAKSYRVDVTFADEKSPVPSPGGVRLDGGVELKPAPGTGS